MSDKYYCVICHKEITDINKAISVDDMFAHDSCWSGDSEYINIKCLAEAIPSGVKKFTHSNVYDRDEQAKAIAKNILGDKANHEKEKESG